MPRKNKLLLSLGLFLLSSQTFSDDNSVSVVPNANTQAYYHRSIIGSGVLAYSSAVANNQGTLYITQNIVTDAPCDGVDAQGHPNTQAVAVIKLENTGSMNRKNYGDGRCTISSYDINAAGATVLRQGTDMASKNFTLSIPFSVQQSGSWHGGFDHKGSLHICGESAWVLTGFAIQYSIYCVPNN